MVSLFWDEVHSKQEVETFLSLSLQRGSLAPSTPLTGRVYLKEKDLLFTPVSAATQSVTRLQTMVAGLRMAPSENLLQIFRLAPVPAVPCCGGVPRCSGVPRCGGV